MFFYMSSESRQGRLKKRAAEAAALKLSIINYQLLIINY